MTAEAWTLVWSALGGGIAIGVLLGMEAHKLLRWLRRRALNRVIN